MTRDDVIRMAQEAGFNLTGTRDIWCDNTAVLEHFAKLIRDDYSNKHAALWLKRIDEAVKAEREACARVAFNAKTYLEAAAAIRARSNT